MIQRRGQAFVFWFEDTRNHRLWWWFVGLRWIQPLALRLEWWITKNYPRCFSCKVAIEAPLRFSFPEVPDIFIKVQSCQPCIDALLRESAGLLPPLLGDPLP